MGESIYDFKVTTKNKEEISLDNFRGKALLIVNTASKCGFTGQYKNLETLYKKYKEQGLEVLGFPCNQFGLQEPGSDEEIAQFCSLNYDVTFPVFSKIEVNGKNSLPLYKYLKSSLPGILGTEDIKWNFTKFLVDKSGKPIKRYAPSTDPLDIETDIKTLL